MATPVAQTYLQLISQDEKAAKSEALKITAQEQALNLNKTIFDYGVLINKTKINLEAAKKAVPYQVENEFTLSRNLAEYEARLAFAQEVKAARFADSQV